MDLCDCFDVDSIHSVLVVDFSATTSISSSDLPVVSFNTKNANIKPIKQATVVNSHTNRLLRPVLETF